MRHFITAFALCALGIGQASAQSAKVSPPPQRPITPEQKTLQVPPSRATVPAATDPFQLGTVEYKTQQTLSPKTQNGEWFAITDESGITTYAATTRPDHQVRMTAEDASTNLRQFLAVAPLTGIKQPSAEFVLRSQETDEQGNSHFRMDQVWQGVPVYGGEIILHTKADVLHMFNGRYQPSPEISVTPALTQEQAREAVEGAFGKSQIQTTWTDAQLRLIGGQPFKATLVVFHNEAGQPHLAYQCTLRPNVLKRIEYVIDAHTGAVLNTHDRTCRFHNHIGENAANNCSHNDENPIGSADSAPSPLERVGVRSAAENNENPSHHLAISLPLGEGRGGAPPVTGSGLDLLDINRSFGAWQEGSTIYMMDATKSMFNSGASTFPANPVGVIATLDAQNTSPENSNFNYTEVKSTSTSFASKKAAVSAHYNAGKCFDYFKTAFNRNSIDGVGGNIISLVNVVESDGSSMENAFWNGDAMWYGNGGSLFFPLARSLDVGGHEMTHGVIEKTANLVYINQSGALNESFADIFGVMIDSADWLLGEDVVRPGVTPNNALRSMSNPHNGDTQGGNFWQPKHMNEIYTGTQDNGGVHINSGITNHAFYLFATNAAVGKVKAQQVYYKALRDYLTKNSRFPDCRVAVIQAASDLYGATVATAAGAAFDAVGILAPGTSGGGGGTTTAPPGNLVTNPGQDLIFVTTTDMQKLQIANGSGQILGDLYTDGLISRPSVTDNGDYVVFVNAAKKIIGISLSYAGGTITPTEEVIGADPVWRNAAISKDGRYAAALTDNQNNSITFVDFSNGQSKDFTLYNPTYTNGQVTNNVDYADVMEFDYSGKYLMYDARNILNNQAGQDISYWDIGFLNFTTGTQWTTGNSIISKLFNGLPDNVSVGNPTFSKNSPHIIAFDVIDGNDNTYDIYGANTETNKNGSLVTNNGDLGWPNHNRLDNAIVFETPHFLGGADVWKKSIANDKISSTGNATSLITSRIRPVWFATGTRSLNVSVDDAPGSALSITASPNPTHDGIWLDLSATTGTVLIEVFCTDGRRLMAERQSASAQTWVPMEQFAEGAYLLRIVTEQGVRTARVVKH